MPEKKAIIADDEEQLRISLRSQLADVWPDLILCGEAKNGQEALKLIEDHRPDIAFLDIKMPGLSGIEVARKIAGSCWIVFITAYDQYAVEAFENEAIDYLMKPVTPQRLEKTVKRLKNRINASSGRPMDISSVIELLNAAMPKDKTPAYLHWIRAQHGNEIQFIPTDEVCYFKASDKYTIVMTKDGESLIRKPIKELANELDPNKFWQINRGTIINAASIASVSRSLTGRFIIRLHDLQEMLTVSRTYAHLFRQM